MVKIIILVLVINACSSTTLTKPNTLIPQPTIPNQIAKDVTVIEAYVMIKDNMDNSKFVILDVRKPEDYSAGYIEGAVLMDMEKDTWLAELESLDRYAIYLVYCGGGEWSSSATEIMKSLNFMEVYDMRGGVTNWEAAGLPVIVP